MRPLVLHLTGDYPDPVRNRTTETRQPQGQLKASLSVAATRARLFGGSKAL